MKNDDGDPRHRDGEGLSEEARKNLDAYFDIALRVYKRLRSTPEGKEHLKKLLEEARRKKKE